MPEPSVGSIPPSALRSNVSSDTRAINDASASGTFSTQSAPTPLIRALRIGWVVSVLIVIVLFIISIPVHHAETRTPVAAEEGRSLYRLGPTDPDRLIQMGMSATFYAAVLNTADVLFMVVHVALAIFVFSVRRNDWKSLLFTLVLVAHGANFGQSLRSLAQFEPAFNIPVNVVVSFYFFGAFMTLLLFPDGRFVPKPLRWLALVWGTIILIRLFDPDFTLIRLPYPYYSFPVVIVYAIGAFAQVYRYRTLQNTPQKRQIALIVFAIVWGISMLSMYFILAYVFPALRQPGETRIYYNLIAVPVLIFGSMLLIPVFVVASIVRRRLWDIQLVVNKALVYSPLTILLGFVYFASVLLLQQVFQLVTGVGQSPVAIAGSTLLIAVLFQPLRNRVQRIVDRAFASRNPVTALRDEMRRNQQHEGVKARFGIYEVYEQIGRGGMAEVYRGRHPSLNRTVAIKMLSSVNRDNAASLRRFEREAQMIAGLRHANIVQVFDFGMVDDTFYMVMEYLQGQTLTEYLQQHGRLSVREALPIIRDVAAALDYAHENNLIHRDVKPANIMLQRPEDAPMRTVLMDFGVARVTKGDHTLTNAGLVGTIDYMAPEQIVSQQSIDGRADVYSLGVVAYEMVTGRKPYDADNAGSVLLAHLQEAVPDPRTIVPDMDANVAYTIMVALSKSPSARYATAGEFYSGLRMSSVTVGA